MEDHAGRTAEGTERAGGRRRRISTAVTLAAALLAAALAPASATVRAPGDDVVLVDCASEPQVRPEDFILACGDGNNRLVDLRWTSWGPQGATATGTDMVNDCVPYCAAGTFRAHPVRVTVSDPRPWPGDDGLRHFTRIRMVFTGTPPAPLPQDVSYDLWD
ncbi:hypothetical protein [Streptomyces sp. NPDC012888]|uniref:hypothetical protein n=1 Tax=Streptomyces sp. NPDC012888 TaxID=3364855 RepID=UPI0036B7A6F2